MNEEAPLEAREALGPAFGDDDRLAEGHAARARVHVEDHAGLERPVRGGEERAGEVARARRVRRGAWDIRSSCSCGEVTHS